MRLFSNVGIKRDLASITNCRARRSRAEARILATIGLLRSTDGFPRPRDTGPDLQTFHLAEGEKMTPQVVLITGALTGIGRATAMAFAKKGAKVVVSGRHDDKGQALVAELRALGAEAEFVRADVTKEDEVRNLVDKTVERFGRLDVAVNNAGFEGELGPIQDATVENFKAVHDTNVLGVFLSMKHELRAMAGQDSGSIVNITSTYGHKAAAGGRPMSAANSPWRA